MSAKFLAVLINEAKGQSRFGRNGDLETRCFAAISRHSGRKAVACIGANRSPAEEPTPQLETLVRILWPEEFPGDRLFIDGGVELVRVLSTRLAELIRTQSSCNRHPKVSRGRHVEAVCF